MDSHDEMDAGRYRWAMGDDVIMNEGSAARGAMGEGEVGVLQCGG